MEQLLPLRFGISNSRNVQCQPFISQSTQQQLNADLLVEKSMVQVTGLEMPALLGGSLGKGEVALFHLPSIPSAFETLEQKERVQRSSSVTESSEVAWLWRVKPGPSGCSQALTLPWDRSLAVS